MADSLVPTAPEVRARLVTLLTALTATGQDLEGVQVAKAHPGDTIQKRSVFPGRTRGTSVVPTARAGRKAREEDYTIELWITVHLPTPPGEVPGSHAETEAFRIYAVVDDLLADDPSLGLNRPTLVARLAGFEQETNLDPVDGGYSCYLRADVGVSCRLR